MLDPDLLNILVCPETKQPVRLAGDEMLARVNRGIEEGTLRTRGGEAPGAPLEAGLVREDGRLLYPVRDDIPIMLVDEAFDLEPDSEG